LRPPSLHDQAPETEQLPREPEQDDHQGQAKNGALCAFHAGLIEQLKGH
jgi:hypothetical protein